MVYKFTARAKKAIDLANEIAMELGHNYIGTEHLLLGTLREGDSIAVRILLNLNVDLPKIYNEILSTVNEIENATGLSNNGTKTSTKVVRTSTPTLEQFGEE